MNKLKVKTQKYTLKRKPKTPLESTFLSEYVVGLLSSLG